MTHPAATAAFWNERWMHNQIGFHEGKPNAHLLRHWPDLGLPPTARVLVPLCGKSADLDWLAAQGHEVTGVELSPLACAAFFAERGLRPEVRPDGPYTRWSAGRVSILQGDFMALQGTWEACWDRAALIALPPELRGQYGRVLRACLAPEARVLLITFQYDQGRRDGPPFSVAEAEVQALYPGARLLHRQGLHEDPRWKEVGLVEELAWRANASEVSG